EGWGGPYMGFGDVDLILFGHHINPGADRPPEHWGPPPRGLHYARFLFRDGLEAGMRRLGAMTIEAALRPSPAPETRASALAEEAHPTTYVADRTPHFPQRVDRPPPWLCWTSVTDPHHPIDRPPPWCGRHAARDITRPAFSRRAGPPLPRPSRAARSARCSPARRRGANGSSPRTTTRWASSSTCARSRPRATCSRATTRWPAWVSSTTAPSTRASARIAGTTRHTREPGASCSRCSPRSRTLRPVACPTRARSRDGACRHGRRAVDGGTMRVVMAVVVAGAIAGLLYLSLDSGRFAPPAARAFSMPLVA